MPSSPRSGASSRSATAASRPPSTGSRRRATSRRSARSAARTPGCAPNERAEARGETPRVRPRRRRRRPPTARPAGRSPATGSAARRGRFAADDHPRIDALADTYVVDGAALEVLRLTELAPVYHAYEAELARRGALDFGEQIAAVTQLFKTRPNVLRRWQRQFRYILVDEFQDANVAQIELIELLGRTPDRPDNVMVVGDDDQSIYRFRGASFAAFAEFDARFARPPAHDPDAPPPGPPPRLRIEQNFRSVRHVLTAANRLIGDNETRFEPDKRLDDRRDRTASRSSSSSAPAPRTRRSRSSTPSRRWRARGPADGWTDVAVLYRKHKHREAIVARLRDEDIPYTVVGGLSPVRDARDPRPRAGAAGDRRPARRRRARPDDDRRPVAARCARDPARHAGWRRFDRRHLRRRDPRASSSGPSTDGTGATETPTTSTPRRRPAPSCAGCCGASTSSTR